MAIPQQLVPPPQYRDMAKAIVDNATGIHEFLNACEQCGLPVQPHREELNSQVDFAQRFLHNFYPEIL